MSTYQTAPIPLLRNEFKRKKNLKQKLNSLIKENPKVYFYAGHGSDRCDKDGNVITAIVPPNCIYITVAVCGETTPVSDESELFIRTTNPETIKIIEQPWQEGAHEKLASMIGVKSSDLNIHFPGDSYIVNTLSPVSDYLNFEEPWGGDFGLGPSGLLSKEQIISSNNKLMNMFYSNQMPIYNLFKDNIKKTYKKTDTFLNECIDIFIENNIQYEILLDLAKEKKNNSLKEEIEDEKLFLKGMGEEYAKTLYKNKENLSLEDLTILYQKLVTIIQKKYFIQYYRHSVYPTVDQIEKYLINFGDTFDKDTLIQAVKKINDKFRTTNTKLMESFPGIHYNLVCRAVSDNCLPKAKLRRSVSKVQLTMRKKNINNLNRFQKAKNELEKKLNFTKRLNTLKKNNTRRNS